MLNILNQDRMSTTFHIVEKNGEIELVHLDKVNIRNTSKMNKDNHSERMPTQNCTCVMCQPVVESNVSTNISENAPADTRVVKNYLKVRRKHISKSKSTDIGTNGIFSNTVTVETSVEKNGISVENDANDPMILIKTEPELEIMDVDMTSSQLERDIEDEVSATRTVFKDSNAPLKDYEKRKSEADVNIKTLQFQLKEIKCNICKMVFPANIQQEPAMKTHFMLHKNSIKTTFRCGICHKSLLDMDYLMIIQHKRSHKKNNLNKNFSSDDRSCLHKAYGDKLQRSGSIALKQIHNTASKVETSNDGGADSDDDIQIVEKKPELIVIDDNDENVMVKKSQKNL